MERLLFSTMMIASLATTVVGSAASFGVGASGLAAGGAVIAKCDPDGFGHSFTTFNGKVTNVTVTDIAAACNGGELSLTLTNSSGTSVGTGGPITVSGSSASADISPQPGASTVAGIHISVVGP